MKHFRILLTILVCAGPLGPLSAAPQNTAFTYQGQLKTDGAPATGNFDFRFTLMDEAVAGRPLTDPLEVRDVAVSAGLFQTRLDFGEDPYANNARWLEIEVRTTGSGDPFTLLAPRQELTATPYALRAKQVDEVLESALPGNVVRSNAAVTFTGPVSFSQPVSGNGGGLTNIPASAVTVPEPLVRWGLTDGRPTPPELQSISAVAAGNSFFLALTPGGRVVSWGSTAASLVVPASLEFENVTAIAAGDGHALARISSGWVEAWGDNSSGQTTVPPPPGPSAFYMAVGAGADHSAALLNDGSLRVWGSNSFGQTNGDGQTGYRAIACGRYNTYAIRINGTVDAWGRNDVGQTSLPFLSSPASQLAAGAAHAVALLEDGRVVAWGLNSSQQTVVPSALAMPRPEGDPLRVTRVAANQSASLALLANGTVVGWGSVALGAIPPVGLANVTTIGSGPSAYDFMAVRPVTALTTVAAKVAFTEGQNVFTSRNIFQAANEFTGENTFSGPNVFTNSNTFTSSNAFSGSNTFSGTNTFSALNTFTQGLKVLDPSGVASLHVTDGLNSNWLLSTVRQGNDGYGLLTFNGEAGANAEARHNPNKVLWRMFVDQRNTTDVFGLGTYNGTGYATAWAANAAGEVGIGTSPVGGFQLNVGGTVRCVSLVQTSDRRYKQDIRPLIGSLEKVSRLQGVSYDWNRADFPDKNFSDRRQIGLIAQDVRDVLPDLVHEDSEGHLGVAYASAVPVLVEAVKELRAENAELKARLEAIERAVGAMKP
jgi:hypothetical protein